MKINLLNTTGISAPVFGSFQCSILAGANLRDANLQAAATTATSPPLVGSWFLTPAPTVLSVIAGNPSADSVYGTNDTIVFTFSEALNIDLPMINQIINKSEVDGVFRFNRFMGTDYHGFFPDTTHFVFRVLNATGNNVTIPDLAVYVNGSDGKLQNAAQTSFYINDTLNFIGGGFATAPAILSVLGEGMSIRIIFAESTDHGVMNGTYNQSAVNVWLQPNCRLGTVYNASWTDASTLRIVIHDNANATCVVGSARFNINASVSALRNAARTSFSVSGLTPLVTGVITPPPTPAPVVIAVTAFNPDNTISYGAGVYTDVIFNMPMLGSNSSAPVSKSVVDSWLQPQAELGDNYVGRWVSATVFRVVIVNGTGANATIGSMLFIINPAAGLVNAANTSYPASGPTPPVGGAWVAIAVPGPSVVSVSAWNPANSSTHTGAQVLITFNMAVNQALRTPPRVYNTSQIDALFQPSMSMGTQYTGAWSTNSTLTITIVNGTGATADSGLLSFNITAAASIRVWSNNSHPFQGPTMAAMGPFYFIPGEFSINVALIVANLSKTLNGVDV